MAPSLADLIADPTLKLVCATGHSLLHRQVARVHVAEVTDPSPWLTKDVLLLTTGLVERTPAELDAFFAALAEREIAAVGFGVGLMVDDIPPQWIRAADLHGIPLLSIPLETPYIAISEFVTRRLTDRQLDQVRRMLNVQQRLAYSNAAPAQQIDGLEQLARELNAAIYWIAPDGIRRTSSGSVALTQTELRGLQDELSRYMASGRPSGAASIGGLFLHLASTAGSPLIVARRRRYSPLEQALIGSIATFIDLSRDTAALPGLAASLREQLITEALTGRMTADARLFETLFPGTEICTVVYFGPAQRPGAAKTREPAAGFLLKSHLTRELAAGLQTTTPLVSAVGDGFVLVLPGIQDVPTAVAVERFLRNEAGTLRTWRAGVSLTGTPGEILALCEKARQAHRATSARPHVHALLASDLNREDLLTEWFQESGEAPVFAAWRAHLADLDPAFASRMIDAAYAFLRANGALERAAEVLGVHRQTLNSRLRDVEREFDLSLSEPTARSLLWLALETGALPRSPSSP